MNLNATQEAVIVVTDTETGEPVAIIRKNGSIKWFTIGEATWADMEELLNVSSPVQH